MVMRTYRHFHGESGHADIERTSENDQPYSMPWGSVTVEGMVEAGEDAQGYAMYSCRECGRPMVQTHVPDQRSRGI